MSAGELPCRWQDAGEGGQELLGAMTRHLPPNIGITARYRGEGLVIMDKDAAVWTLDGDGVTRVVYVSEGTAELTTWREGQETARMAMPRSPSS